VDDVILINNKVVGSHIILDYDTTLHTVPFESVMYSHDTIKVPCMKTTLLSKIDISTVDTISINEAQFFSDLIPFVKLSLQLKKNVFVYGLDGDFKQEVFGSIIYLIPMADTYTKLYAVCKCSNRASFSKRLSTKSAQYSPDDTYIPVCRTCLIDDV
jgi:thymidine kinase